MNDQTPTQRDCKHGRLRRKCEICDLEIEVCNLERELADAKVQLTGWEYAASTLRGLVGLPDGTDLREVWLKFRELDEERKRLEQSHETNTTTP